MRLRLRAWTIGKDGNKRVKYITGKTHGGNAGAGHRFVNFLVPYVLAKKYNLKFVYQLFVEKDESNIHKMAPAKKWNDFLNFGENELTINDLPKQLLKVNVPYVPQEVATWDHWIFKKELERPYKSDVLYCISEEKEGQFISIDWNIFNDNGLRNKYHLAKSKQPQPINYLDSSVINIALHRRADDVSSKTQFGRWISLDYYLNIIDNINKIKFKKQHLIHLYSSNIDPKEIDRLKEKSNIQFHINENIFDTFHNMVNCDILINGQSSFSVMAAYLSYGIKLCTPWNIFWNNFPNQPDIISIDSTGSFDSNKLLTIMEKKYVNR